MKRDLKDDILIHCIYDWTALANVYGIAMNLFPEEEASSLKNLIRIALSSLIKDGLVEVGYITEKEFVPFEEMVSTYKKHMDDSFEGDEDQFDFWISNTEKGDDLGKEIEKIYNIE